MNHRLQQEGWPSRHPSYPRVEERPPCADLHRQNVPQSWLGEDTSLLLAQPHSHARSFSDVSTTPAPQILVIDDSATVRKIVEVCHQRAGFVIEPFRDGYEALKWLSLSQVLLPPLIYLDIEMPRMDGYEVALKLHARPDFAHTTLILLSGRDKVTDRLKGRLVGAQAYVTKPFKEQELIATTQSYLTPTQHPSFAPMVRL